MRRLALIGILTLSIGPALALDLPTRKAGQWQLTMTFEGRNLPPQVMKQCTDASTDKLMNANFGGSNEMACSKQEVTKTGAGYTIDAVCTFGDMTTTSHSVVSGTFDSAYKIEMTSTRKGGPQLPGVTPGAATRMTIDAKWLGACAAGQKPGDVTMANGMTMNVLDLQKARALPAR